MIGYVTLGTDDLAAAAAFYDALLAEFGAKRILDLETFIVWSAPGGAASLSVTKPYDGRPASVGNGVMVALAAPSREAVDRIHAKALALGAANEGDPGPRPPEPFYAAYFRDPAGHKLNVFHFG